MDLLCTKQLCTFALQFSGWWSLRRQLPDPRACAHAAVGVGGPHHDRRGRHQKSGAPEPSVLAFQMSSRNSQVVFLRQVHSGAHKDVRRFNEGM